MRNEGSAPPVTRNLAANDDLFPIRVEDRLDGRDVFAGPNEIARRARAEQKADRFDEDRFAGARFAGQDVEPSVEIDLDAFDDREVLNAQEAQHEREEAGLRIKENAATSIVAYP